MSIKVAMLWVMVIGAAIAAVQVDAREHAQRAMFVRQNPCPVTGSAKPHHSCPGWVVDHVVPLCAGGPDAPENMQWQELAPSKMKDKEERRLCRQLKKQVG